MERLSIFGEEYEIRLDKCLLMDHSKKLITMNPDDPRHRGRLLKTLKAILLGEIGPKIKEYSKKLGVRVTRVTIKNMRSRWGSCSGEGSLNFNLWLVCLPRELIHYVVLHEVAHIKERNHDRKFKNILSEEFRNRRELEKTLRSMRIESPSALA